MDKFIVKWFGVNKFNFWFWVVSGLLITVLAVGLMIYSATLLRLSIAGAQYAILVAIAVVLMGQFALALQKYHAKLAEKIEQQNKNKV